MATENLGKFGYIDLDTLAGMEFVLPPGSTNLCGVSIGYLPSTNAVYFGFVHCTGGNQTTQIYRHNVNSATFSFVGTAPMPINGPWVLGADGKLYNTGHDSSNDQVCLFRRDSDQQWTQLLPCFPIAPSTVAPFGPHWSHALYNNMFYYSEFDGAHPSQGGGDNATAYRIVSAPPPTNLQRFALGPPAQSTTFLHDTLRGQLFAFGSFRSGLLQVACSLNGVNFELRDQGFSPNRYGPTGSVATVWESSPTTVAWGHTPTAKGANLPPSRAIVSVSTASCR